MKFITLDAWAERLDPAPAINTLRAWARSGKFDPPAQKMGRTYYVDENAEYCDSEPLPDIPDAPLINRIERARHGTKTPFGRLQGSAT